MVLTGGFDDNNPPVPDASTSAEDVAAKANYGNPPAA
jgi:hypothetical protein